MKIEITKKDKVPELYETENIKDPEAKVKFFTPDSNFTWFITEYSKETDMAFGLVVGFEMELGYISLEELRTITGPLGLGVERDLNFVPKKISEIKKNYR